MRRVELDGEDGVAGDDHRDVRHRRTLHRADPSRHRPRRARRHGTQGVRMRAPGHAAHPLTRGQAVDPLALRLLGPGQCREGQEAREERNGCGVPTDLLEQDRRLHPTQADAAVGLRQRDGQPALIGQRAPKALVVGTARIQVRPDLIVTGAVVEEVAGRVLKGQLVRREFEVHRGSW